jgi:hypothetical protein
VLDDTGKITGARLKHAAESGGIMPPAGTLTTTKAWAPCPSPRAGLSAGTLKIRRRHRTVHNVHRTA